MKKILTGLLLAVLFSGQSLAQSSPGFYYKFTPTYSQWNSYFAGKQDYLGYVPLSPNGVNMTGKFTTAAPSATDAGLVVTPGSAPSAPTDGAIWVTTSGMYVRINGVTKQVTVTP